MGAVVESENMRVAYRQVVGNKGSAGVDGMSVAELKPYLVGNWRRIREELLEGRYRPQPVLRVEIPKAGGGVRKLGIPAVRKAKEYVASGRRWVLRLIRRYLQAGVTEDGMVEAGREGTYRLCCRSFFLISLTRNWRGEV
jgi:hypothetical protein